MLKVDEQTLVTLLTDETKFPVRISAMTKFGVKNFSHLNFLFTFVTFHRLTCTSYSLVFSPFFMLNEDHAKPVSKNYLKKVQF